MLSPAPQRIPAIVVIGKRSRYCHNSFNWMWPPETEQGNVHDDDGQAAVILLYYTNTPNPVIAPRLEMTDAGNYSCLPAQKLLQTFEFSTDHFCRDIQHKCRLVSMHQNQPSIWSLNPSVTVCCIYSLRRNMMTWKYHSICVQLRKNVGCQARLAPHTKYQFSLV